ncbi:1-acyl-sn-glycerol-3-phosphate acyltransferase [Runella sp. MFBS21]|uniref:1-acyl-sn-glycerol-3-phosphate acyltransferase n=1 Tax=Runella sp. MFBS21 TaxID=3034018 RepID=UPI0023F905DF|nr:1-acyl-sn-glycerol-3-phosphate acyltransferase [Runella sp. MFBS21]MDF7818731.1 1-acyl-sn-glycerol-3-phosphate acyltransferase [Runella sp. MFBS21]
MSHRSFFYSLLRAYVRFWHNRIFYRKVEIKNFPKNLSTDIPLLIVTNHQNTLMDALAVVLNVGERQPYFLTRADIFKKDFVRKLLMSLKMLPVYRLRDGMDEMKQNDDIFNTCVKILSTGGTLAAFPEGNHGVQYHLRSFKKGLARIAFQAETEHDWRLNLQILPCGLYYTHCQKMGERLVLNFGEPFKLSEYQNAYQENPPRTLTQVTRRMYDSIQALMLHIDDLPHHDDYKWLIDVASGKGGDLMNTVLSTRKELDELRKNTPEKYMGQIQAAHQQRLLMEPKSISPFTVGKGKPAIFMLVLKMLFLLISSPLALYGVVNNGLPYAFPFLMTRKLKDPQFSSAFRIVLFALVTFPIFYLIQISIVGIFTDAQSTLLYALSLPISGYLTHHWARKWSETIQQWQL